MQPSESHIEQTAPPPPRETRPLRAERPAEAQEAAPAAAAEEKETLRVERTAEQAMAEHVASFTVEELRSKQDHLTESLRQWKTFLDEQEGFLDAQMPILLEKIAEEQTLLDAIHLQRGKLGDYPDIPKAPRMAREFAPTEYPQRIAPSIPAGPRAKRRAAQDPGPAPTVRQN